MLASLSKNDLQLSFSQLAAVQSQMSNTQTSCPCNNYCELKLHDGLKHRIDDMKYKCFGSSLHKRKLCMLSNALMYYNVSWHILITVNRHDLSDIWNTKQKLYPSWPNCPCQNRKGANPIIRVTAVIILRRTWMVISLRLSSCWRTLLRGRQLV